MLLLAQSGDESGSPASDEYTLRADVLASDFRTQYDEGYKETQRRAEEVGTNIVNDVQDTYCDPVAPQPSERWTCTVDELAGYARVALTLEYSVVATGGGCWEATSDTAGSVEDFQDRAEALGIPRTYESATLRLTGCNGG